MRHLWIALSARPTESGRIRLVIGETEGIRFEGRDCEILAGMKGWRPSACQGSKTGSGSLWSGIGSIGLSLFPVLGLLGPRRGTPLFAQRGSAAARVGRKRRPSVRDKKKAPALHLPRKPEELELKTKKTTLKPWKTAAPTQPIAAFEAGSRHRNKKRPWGSA